MTDQERTALAAREFDAMLIQIQQQHGVVLQKTLTYVEGVERPEIGLRFVPIPNWQPKPAQADFAPETETG